MQLPASGCIRDCGSAVPRSGAQATGKAHAYASGGCAFDAMLRGVNTLAQLRAIVGLKHMQRVRGIFQHEQHADCLTRAVYAVCKHVPDQHASVQSMRWHQSVQSVTVPSLNNSDMSLQAWPHLVAPRAAVHCDAVYMVVTLDSAARAQHHTSALGHS
jgi:hypothetical protein